VNPNGMERTRSSRTATECHPDGCPPSALRGVAESTLVTDLKTLRTRLYGMVGASVSELGFKTEKLVFRRPMGGGSQTLHLAFIAHKTDFDVTADVAIRFDDVQALLLEGNTAIKPEQAGVMMSFGAELGNIAERKQRRWTVRTEAGLPAVADQVTAAFLDIGRPYLETYSDRHAALEVLAGDDQAAWLHMPLHGQRARLALALCVVLGERFRFATLLAQKLDFLAARKDADLEGVRAFGERLRGKFPA
jgi:hypothetical protein